VNGLRRWIHGASRPLKVAWRARDPVEAQVVAAVLEQAGIRVLVRRRTVPGYEGAVERAEGVFADLLVAEGELHRARVLVAKFLEAPPEP
jgi:hypothetical protein